MPSGSNDDGSSSSSASSKKDSKKAPMAPPQSVDDDGSMLPAYADITGDSHSLPASTSQRDVKSDDPTDINQLRSMLQAKSRRIQELEAKVERIPVLEAKVEEKMMIVKELEAVVEEDKRKIKKHSDDALVARKMMMIRADILSEFDILKRVGTSVEASNFSVAATGIFVQYGSEKEEIQLKSRPDLLLRDPKTGLLVLAIVKTINDAYTYKSDVHLLNSVRTPKTIYQLYMDALVCTKILCDAGYNKHEIFADYFLLIGYGSVENKMKVYKIPKRGLKDVLYFGKGKNICPEETFAFLED
ncbi:hypothetical protein HDU97_005054 [Phlyctochytrium planicorne]|nr:hypothetical protein HDU97_005054 [Phlyctochytrium planicorne]